MPLTIQQTALKYRDDNGVYHEVDCLKGDDATPELIAPDYEDLTFPVVAGTHCYHSGNLYVANQAISTSEVWTAAHWDETVVGNEIEALSSAINVSQPTAQNADVGKFLKLKTIDQNGKPTEFEYGSASGGGVSDVKVNGTSVVSQGEANVPMASTSAPGVVLVDSANGIDIDSNNKLKISCSAKSYNKAGGSWTKPIVPAVQDSSVFYGLSKIAGYDLKNVTVTEWEYPESSKSAIHNLLDAPETVSGSTPSITAKPGVRYICGEVSTLTVVVPASGIIDVVFDSGSTPTVLTVTPPTGMTMKWIGADPTALEANKTYEVNIMDGCYGMVVAWT